MIDREEDNKVLRASIAETKSAGRETALTFLNTFPVQTPVSACRKAVPLSTLTKFRNELKCMTPVDKAKWSDYHNWSPRSKSWFSKNIPLYELDCMMGINPLSSSIHTYCMSLAEEVKVVSGSVVVPTTTTTTLTSSIPFRSFQNSVAYPFTEADFGTPPDFDMDFDPVEQTMDFDDFDDFDPFPVSSLADTFMDISSEISLSRRTR